jgi:predicted ATPase/DNA-binding XRE family transcriptional regulator
MTPDHESEQANIGFARALHAHRRAAGMTQAELAGRAGVGVRTVRDLERGRASRPQRNTVELLAVALGLTGRQQAEFVALARGPAARSPAGQMDEADQATVPLPPPVDLVGRDRELTDLAESLTTGEELVTLVGLAGVGKSSLALAVIHQVAGKFSGGVAGIAVSEVSTEADVLAAAASVFGVGKAADLASRFTGGPGLLLVDAVERAPGPTADALRWLATVAPALRVLATGRHPVGLAGERVWLVTPLEEPPADVPADLAAVAAYPAADLFLVRLRQLRREPVTPGEVPALVSLVRRLGGLPLALELAAGWGRVLDVTEMLDRYGDRVLDLGAAPATGERTAEGPVTLRDAVAASYLLLEPAEKYALRMLSVFRNRWSVELAEALLTDADQPGGGPAAGDPVPLLDRLVAFGLIGVRGTGPYRFRLLDPVRDFALEQAAAAGELTEAGRRHARIFAQLAARITPDLVGGNLPAAVARLDEVASDLWAALAHATTDDPHTALELAAKLPRWWRFRGRDVPGRQWLQRLLDDPRTTDADPAVRAWARVGVAQLAHEHGAGQQELPVAEQALEEFQRLGDLTGELAARSLLCALWMVTGGYDEARRHNEAVLSLAARTGRIRDMAVAQINLTWHEIREGELAAARRRLAAGDRLAAQCGDPRLRALARANLAELARLGGRYDEAVSRGRRAEALLAEVGDPGHRHRVLGTVGLALAQAGRVDEAAEVLADLRVQPRPGEVGNAGSGEVGNAGSGEVGNAGSGEVGNAGSGEAGYAWSGEAGKAVERAVTAGTGAVSAAPLDRLVRDDGASAAIEATIALQRGDRELAAEWFTVAAYAYTGKHDLRDVAEALVGVVASTDDPAARTRALRWLDSVCQEGGITLLPRERGLIAEATDRD